MASDDGAQCLHVGSDAVYTYTCEPCDYRGVNREAITFCRNCKEYMCHLCTESHKGQKMSRNHKLLDVKDMTGMQTSTVSDSFVTAINHLLSPIIVLNMIKHVVLIVKFLNTENVKV